LKTGRFSFVSEQAEKILGYPVESWFAESTFLAGPYSCGDRAQALAFRTQVVQEKKDSRCEYRMITADGRTLWMRDLVTIVVEKNEAVNCAA